MTDRWVWTEADGTWSIQGKDVWIWMVARPFYCDRGHWLAQIGYRAEAVMADRIRVSLDGQDGWPRYYFDFDRAKLECEAWLKKRGQWIDDAAAEERPTP